MKILRQSFLLILMLLVSNGAFAVDPVFTPLFSDKAIRGYDSVAYFTQNKAVKGDEQYSYEYKEATWLFANQEHLDLFKANPEKYEPQYGGYCAYAVANNSTASIKPELFTILNDKLYLNYNEKINETWSKNRDQFIQDADRNWPTILAD